MQTNFYHSISIVFSPKVKQFLFHFFHLWNNIVESTRQTNISVQELPPRFLKCKKSMSPVIVWVNMNKAPFEAKRKLWLGLKSSLLQGQIQHIHPDTIELNSQSKLSFWQETSKILGTATRHRQQGNSDVWWWNMLYKRWPCLYFPSI